LRSQVHDPSRGPARFALKEKPVKRGESNIRGTPRKKKKVALRRGLNTSQRGPGPSIKGEGLGRHGEGRQGALYHLKRRYITASGDGTFRSVGE